MSAPVDSSVIIRSRSALGLKYLQITRGTSDKGYAAGSVLPLSAAHPELREKPLFRAAQPCTASPATPPADDATKPARSSSARTAETDPLRALTDDEPVKATCAQFENEVASGVVRDQVDRAQRHARWCLRQALAHPGSCALGKPRHAVS